MIQRAAAEQRPYRVVQWTTGNVGRRSVLATIANPALELVGCYAWSPDKVGRDVGELARTEPIGVVATDDKAALLALKPDCVIYNPKWPDVEEMAEILESGANIVATAGFITGHALGAGRDRLIDACRARLELDLRLRHESGTGESAGNRLRHALRPDRFPLRPRVRRFHRLRLRRHRDVRRLSRRPIDDPGTCRPSSKRDGCLRGRGAPDGRQPRCRDRRSALRVVVRPDDPGSRPRIVVHPAGCVAGVAASWQGRRDGETVVELNVRWRKGKTWSPTGRSSTVTSSTSRASHASAPSWRSIPEPDFQAKTFSDYMVLGMIMTAMPAINAIPGVCAADPGIVTYLDIPLTAPRGWVR